MRGFAISFLLAGFALSSASSPFPTRMKSSSEEVARIRSVETALYSTPVTNKLLQVFAADAVVIDPYHPALAHGLAQIRVLFDDRFAGVRTRTPDIRQMDVVANDDFACVAMQVRETDTMIDGRTIIKTVRHLDTLQRIGGNWKVVQQHSSIPALQPGGQPALDVAVAFERPEVWFPSSPITAPIPSRRAEAEIYRWMLSGTHTTSADQMMAWYAKDDSILLYDAYAPGYMRGPKRIRDYYAPMMANFKAVQTSFPQFYARSNGVLGSQIDTQVLTVTTATGLSKTYRLRQNDCVIRIGGKWKTFFEHISVPATGDMQPSKASAGH